jgi:hypothetical protein
MQSFNTYRLLSIATDISFIIHGFQVMCTLDVEHVYFFNATRRLCSLTEWNGVVVTDRDCTGSLLSIWTLRWFSILLQLRQ